ncbi:MAG: 2-C-methyl-D-erythritol 4-phosphate cytidylyltransferase [Gammaproteobacteria bacterium]|nr:2-C-methyl-D-erythritol 4-phosphate cytidylyltransferase [Gammaproteobacteria bacterium]
MGAGVPKQYLPLAGRPLLAHAVERVAGHPRVSGAVVVLARDDALWDAVELGPVPRPRRATGGAERCHSVLNGLEALADDAAEDDWVLVHDAARPCVRREDIDRLMDELAGHPVGGLLGLPARDTLKRADPDGNVRETVARAGLWRALTPQMFRFGLLRRALQAAIGRGLLVTDEAQAVELAGHVPRLVEGSPDNVKVTAPRDLALAELFLRAQEAHQ